MEKVREGWRKVTGSVNKKTRESARKEGSRKCGEGLRLFVCASLVLSLTACSSACPSPSPRLRLSLCVLPSCTGPAPRNSELQLFAFHDFPDLPGVTSNLKNYYFSEASKYNFLSKRSTHGYYIQTKQMCFEASEK